MRNIAITIAIGLALLCACGRRNSVGRPEDARAVLEEMRRDKALKAYADSMGVLQLGEGTRCIDPVSHLYVRDGRTFLYNEDWGGVLELPQGWIPDDDLWQAVTSFHGTRVWSPDSTILFSTYAGYGEMELVSPEAVAETLAGQGFTVTSHSESHMLLGAHPARCISVTALGEDGILYHGRTVFTEDGQIEYSISLQYQEEDQDRVSDLMASFGRYPLGPEGQVPVGDALI